MNHNRPRCHDGHPPLDIRKSSFKKVSALLLHLQDQGLIVLKSNHEVIEGADVTTGEVLYLVDFTKKHEMFRGVKVEDPEALRRQVEGDEGNNAEGTASLIPIKVTGGGSDRPMQVVELFKLNKTFKEVVGNVVSPEYAGLATFAEVKHLITDYILKNGLEDPSDRSQAVFNSDHPIVGVLNMSMIPKKTPKESIPHEVPPKVEDDVKNTESDYVAGVWMPSTSDKQTPWKPVELPKPLPPPAPIVQTRQSIEEFQVKKDVVIKAAVAKLGNYHAIIANGRGMNEFVVNSLILLRQCIRISRQATDGDN